MGLLKVVEFKENFRDRIVYKYPFNNDFISKGSKVIVREGQCVVFADKGKMADVFLPGTYTLDTNNVPLLTKLMSWKYGFESPFKSDIYFVNTTQFLNEKWGTANPILIRDPEYGPIRVRGFGTYSFKIKDAHVFLQEVSGSGSSYEKGAIVDWLKSMVIRGISDALGENKIPVLDVAGNLNELSKLVAVSLAEDFNEIGLDLVKFNFENFSLPPELEKILDEVTGLNMKRGVLDVYTQVGQVDAMKEAAKNPGVGGAFMGAGMGMAFGQQLGKNITEGNQNIVCPKCGKSIAKNAKFCPECGASMVCSCGAAVVSGAKFCPECGKKY
jgi:membrane protease subunit (stomatin/prohibitin family)